MSVERAVVYVCVVFPCVSVCMLVAFWGVCLRVLGVFVWCVSMSLCVGKGVLGCAICNVWCGVCAVYGVVWCVDCTC